MFDWTVPREWNIRDAYVKGADGRRVIDFQASNLHVVGYSVPVRARLPLAELRKHLFSRPDRPDVVPYRTSYYAETWGFCVSHRQLEQMPEGEYEVVIDSTLEAGSLTYGEYYLRGRDRGRGTDLVPHLPSFARQRQSLGHGAGRLSGPAPVLAAATVLVPIPVHPGNDRLHHVAGPKRGASVADPPWPRGGVRRRSRPVHLQEEPAGRRGDRPGGRARPPARRRAVLDSRLFALRIR